MAGSDSPDVSGPPYPPQHLGLGGDPTVIPDVPVSSLFLALFTFGAIAHMGLFQINLHKRKKKFAFNAATFGFCFTRIIATSLRIGWACHPRNISLGLSAQIFVYAGIPILFFCTLFWTERIVRAQHPQFGWSKPSTIWMPILVVIAILTVIALISAVIVQFYDPSDYAQSWTRGVQIYGATLFAVFALLPIPIIFISTIIKTYPTIKDDPIDNFGSGSLFSKVLITTISSFVLSLGAWYRAITTYLTPQPITSPSPWYFSKGSFYTFNFTLEIMIVLFWLFIRIDKRFIIPDGAHGPGSYANGFIFAGEPGNEKNGMSTRHLTSNSSNFLSSGASNRSSTQTLPPPTLSRADSWGSEVHQYMSRSSTPVPLPAHSKSKKEQRISWGGRCSPRVDSCFDAHSDSEFEENTIPITYDVRHPGPIAVRGSTHEMGFDPASGKWDIRSLSMYSDREDLRPGSSLVTAPEYTVRPLDWSRRRDMGSDRICTSCRRCATCGAKS